MLSIPGLTIMLVGLSLIAMELRYMLMLQRVGLGGRILIFLTGGWLSVWGLKEVIAAWWPKLNTDNVLTRRHRFMMPVEGYVYVVVMIVLFIGSLIGHSNPLMLVFALLAGPFVVNGGITFSMLRGLHVQRRVPRRVMAGEPFSVEIELRNPKRWLSAWLMIVRDKVDNGREYLNPEILFVRVSRRSFESGRYQLRLSQRGFYRFGPVQVNSRFPLGLVERGLVLNESGEILVYPEIGRLTTGWRQYLQAATQQVSRARARVGTFQDDFHRIREYRPGDEPRSIHWRSTARRSELMVREFRESRDRQLLVLLDAWHPERPTTAHRARLEYAISLAATICLEQLRSGQQSDLFFAVNGSEFQEWGGSTDLREQDELLDLLARLQPSASVDIQPLLQAAYREQTPHSRTMLITPFAERSSHVDWTSVVSNGTGQGPAWSAAPRVVVADPAELGELFHLTSHAPAKSSTTSHQTTRSTGDPQQPVGRSDRSAHRLRPVAK